MYFTESLPHQLDDLLWRICVGLQITPTQYESAKQHYTAVGHWLEADGSLLQVLAPSIYPQGSVLIGTTVRPQGRTEYDVDLVCEFLRADWRAIRNPVVLLDAVEERFKQHDTYRGMIKRRNRCISLIYKGAFHLDILPGCPDPSTGQRCLVVPDRQLRGWRASNPKGFASWFESRADAFDRALLEKAAPFPGQEEVDDKPPLKRAVQLLKRWRDLYYAEMADVAPISIVLTTLAATYYGGEGTAGEALRAILDGIVCNLPAGRGRLIVLNPTNPKEDLSERWDEGNRYAAFVSGIQAFRDDWQNALAADGYTDITRRLEKLFGEELAKSAVKQQAELIEKARHEGSLGTRRGLGTLGAAVGPAFVPVRRNSFYGD